LNETKAKRLIVLGDIVHSPQGVTKEVVESVAIWRSSFDGELVVIRGNHEKNWKELPKVWRVDHFVDEWTDEPFVFRHDPAEGKPFVFCGHEHPMFSIGNRADRVRLPCFHFTLQQGVLPAFSEFTRGRNINPSHGGRIYLALPDAVVPW
jgi:metallophosphoesterase superfamily enzyme